MVIVTQGERDEHPRDHDVTEPEHRITSGICEGQRLGPKQLYRRIQTSGDFDHLQRMRR